MAKTSRSKVSERGTDPRIPEKVEGIRVDIIDRFVHVKQMLGLSGAEIARGSGQTRSYISRIESKQANIGLDLLVYLVYVQRVSIDWLLTGTGKPMSSLAPAKADVLWSRVEDLSNEVRMLREEMNTYGGKKKK